MAWRRCAAKAVPSRSTVIAVGTALSRWFSSDFTRLESAARPGYVNHGAVIRKGPVAEGNLCAGALKQGSGDEHAEAKAIMLVLRLVGAAPPRQIGFADAVQHVGCDARSIVGNDDLDGLGVPPRVHLHGRAREIDGVFQDIADTIKDRRIARADRLAGAGDSDPHLDVDTKDAMRGHQFFDQGGQWHPVE